MKAITTLNISYKVLNFPVRVCTLVGKPSGLKECCPDCNADVNNVKLCRTCDKEIAWTSVGKKFALGKDEKILTKEQIDSLKNLSSEIKIAGIVDEDQLNQSYIQSSYLILPQTKIKKKSEQDLIEKHKKNYAKLREAIIEARLNHKEFLVSFSIRDREKLGKLVIENNAIVLCVLAYSEHIRENDETDDLEIDLTEKEKLDSKKLVKSVKKIDFDKVNDRFTETLEKILSGKTEPQDREEKSDDSDMWGSL